MSPLLLFLEEVVWHFSMAIGDTSNTPAVVVVVVVVVAVTDGATEESTAEEEAELAVDDVDLRSVAGSPTMTGSGV